MPVIKQLCSLTVESSNSFKEKIMTKVIRKNLGGYEDLLLGTGTESQTRGDDSVVVTKINSEWVFYTVAEIQALDVLRFKHVTLVNIAASSVKKYDYNAASTATPNDQDIIQPDVGSGRWILRRENNTQTQDTATGASGAANSSHTGIPTGFVITTTYSDDTQTPGTGASYQYTGTTDADKAGDWPNADGYYYDADGKQFQLYDQAQLPTGITSVLTTSYTFVLTDMCKAGGKGLVAFNNGSEQAATIPPNSSVKFPLGQPINLIQLGAGKVTIVPGAGVTISGGLSTTGQYNALSLIQVTTNNWVVIGGKNQVNNVGVSITLSPQTLSTTDGLCGIILNPNGEMSTIDDSGTTDLPNEWALPKTPNLGSLYDVRLLSVTGSTQIGSMLNVWIPLTDTKGWGVQHNGTTVNFTGNLEIRLRSTLATVDTAFIDLTSVA
jgi:hypothetical protein